MARETLTLTNGKKWHDYEVEYREIDHFYGDAEHHSGRKLKRYEVLVDGKLIGKVHSFEHSTSTTYAGTRIRRDLGRPLAWGWDVTGGESNSPGLYPATRRDAVIEMLNASKGMSKYHDKAWRKPYGFEKRGMKG